MSDAAKQFDRDRYYMGIAAAVETGANCLGSHVGRPLLEDRVISTGYNGIPSG